VKIGEIKKFELEEGKENANIKKKLSRSGENCTGGFENKREFLD
jgi:hypothetical protein